MISILHHLDFWLDLSLIWYDKSMKRATDFLFSCSAKISWNQNIIWNSSFHFFLFCKNAFKFQLLLCCSAKVFRENTSSQEKFTLVHFSQIFCFCESKITLLKIVWNQKNALNILFTFAENSWNQRLWKYKCHVVCKKLGIGVLY